MPYKKAILKKKKEIRIKLFAETEKEKLISDASKISYEFNMKLESYIRYPNFTNHKKTTKSNPVTTKNIYRLHMKLKLIVEKS